MTAYVSEIMHRADRLMPMMLACTAGIGWTHRAHIYCFGDSTDGNTGWKLDGTAGEDSDWPSGRRHGLELALMRAGLYVGGPLTNNTLNDALTPLQSNAFSQSVEGNIATDPYADATAIALTAGRSVGFSSAGSNNPFWFGSLMYINATPKPVVHPAFSSILQYVRANPIAVSFVNPFPIGDQTAVQVRLHYSIATNSDTTDVSVQVNNFSTDRGTNRHNGAGANTAGAFQNKSILCDVNSSGTLSLYATCNDKVNDRQSTGPALLSGFQFTHKDVDPANPTLGPYGFALSTIFKRTGNTLTQLAADLKYVSTTYPGAIGEWFRAGQRKDMVSGSQLFKFGLILLDYLGNDINGVLNSFKYTDSPTGASARDSAPTASGPIESGATGVIQNLSTIGQILEEALTAQGFTLSDFKILFRGAHNQPAGTVAATSYPTIMQAVCDWIDGSATYAAYRQSPLLCVQRTERQLSALAIMDAQGYNQAAALAITAISTANPPQITCANHGIVTGDIVWFSGTNETVNGAFLKLSSSSLGTSTTVGRQFLATRIDANTISVVTGVAPAVAGTKGFICARKDYSHLDAPMQIVIGQMDLDLMLATAGALIDGSVAHTNPSSMRQLLMGV